MKTALKPIGDNLIIEPHEKSVTRGGIVIPDQAKEKPTRGRVVACGPGRTLASGKVIPLTVGVGDEVLFHRHGAESISDGEREWLLASESDVLAVIPREDCRADGMDWSDESGRTEA